MPKSSFPNGFANGVIIRGLPLQVTHPGEVFWVNSTSVLPVGGLSPSDGNNGTYLQPFKTIAVALNKCTADRGDIIMVMPGYTETVILTGGFPIDVAGVAIIGCGVGSLKPTITLNTDVGADIEMTAANTSIFNFRVVSDLANMLKGINVSAVNCTIDRCEFMCSGATEGLLTPVISTTAALDLHVTNCVMNNESSIAGVSVSDVATSGIEFLGDGTVIRNNIFMGAYATSCILNGTTAEGILIEGNHMFNVSSAAAGMISLEASCSGLIRDNLGMVLDTSTVIGLIINGGCGMIRNFAGNVITETGALIPVVVST